MRKECVVGAVVGVLVVIAAPQETSAQKISKGTLSGTLFTAGATANAGSATLYTAPATAKDGIAIITSVCVGDSSNARIAGSTLGALALPASAPGCIAFDAGGVPLPPGEVLTLTQPNAFDASARINGVISKK